MQQPPSLRQANHHPLCVRNTPSQTKRGQTRPSRCCATQEFEGSTLTLCPWCTVFPPPEPARFAHCTHAIAPRRANPSTLRLSLQARLYRYRPAQCSDVKRPSNFSNSDNLQIRTRLVTTVVAKCGGVLAQDGPKTQTETRSRPLRPRSKEYQHESPIIILPHTLPSQHIAR
jgi:hypothetical protein